MRLKSQEGWNQTPADFERFLRANPAGCFAAEEDGRVVGIIANMVFADHLGWVGLLVVDSEYRRRGIGTHLLQRAVEYLEGTGVTTIKLDATPQGKHICEKMGFVAEYEIERWLLHREPLPAPTLSPSAVPDIERIIEADLEAFGADRSELLRSRHADAPDFTLAVELEGSVIGYALGRGGSWADHLGPWMAWDEPTARELLDEFLRRSTRGEVIVDCPRSNEMARELLLSRGFLISRHLTRMVRGPDIHPGRPELCCGILGPKFG